MDLQDLDQFQLDKEYIDKLLLQRHYFLDKLHRYLLKNTLLDYKKYNS